ncbi:MAG: ribose-phosphate pyrophosphokinase [Anaerolineae bacterium]|nr:ribose-phosphate pyrophosphokinase [Anaerolineae bacterium]
MKADDMMVFAGSGSPGLTARICSYLQIEPGKNETLRFSEGNTFVRILENVRGRQVYLVQSTVFPTNDNFMELLFWIDAFKRASAAAVTVIIPYFSYAKGDKKDEPRVSIRARVCADAIEVAGATRVVAMDLHSPQIQGFFRIPVDNLYALPALGEYIQQQQLQNMIVVSPDAGFTKQARKYATFLGTSVAIANKERPSHDEHAEVLEIIGDVKGKTAIVVDDFTISGGTLAAVSTKLIERGAREVYAMVTHGVLAEGSMERIAASPLKKLIITDTVENQPVAFSDKIEVVSVAHLLGEAIRRIHYRESISAMLFPK